MLRKVLLSLLLIAPLVDARAGIKEIVESGYGGRARWPEAKFYTQTDCDGEKSEPQLLAPSQNGVCYQLNKRTALMAERDPEIDRPKIRGCVYLYKSEDCSENADGNHKDQVVGMTLDLSKQDKEVCTAFATQTNEELYQSYMIEIVDSDAHPDLYCEDGYDNIGYISQKVMDGDSDEELSLQYVN